MTRLTLPMLLLVVSFPSTLAAQTSIHAGLAIGRQSFDDAAGTNVPRVLTSADVLFRFRPAVGLHVAGEYADSDSGALMVVHPNLAFRRDFAGRAFVMLGAGLTSASLGSAGHRTTWNAAAELGRATGRLDLFVRVRHYDYAWHEWRRGDLGPDGPSIYAGARFRVR